MPLLGDLRTMSLSDLLFWAGRDRKTGVMELERNKVCRRVEFRTGWVGACSSSDPSSRLGQFLLARGKITEENLRDALARQQDSAKNLGRILLEMGLLSRQELTRQISAKAEETMYGLFEWEDAVFRFNEGATLDPDHIEVSLSVEEIVQRGRQRADDLGAIRKAFASSGVVLRRTGRELRNKSLKRPMARRILDSINGERTLAEILLHAGASEFVVLKFLFHLHLKGLLEIREQRPVASDSPSLLDVADDSPSIQSLPFEAVELGSFADGPVADGDEDRGPVVPTPDTDGHDFEIQVAQRLVARGELPAALELLNAAYRVQPDDNYLRRLLVKTEAAYVEAARRHALAFHKIPVLLSAVDTIDRETLRPEESFLLSVIDGRCDIQSMLWVTPLREVDILMALGRMLDRGLIELQGLGQAAAGSEPRTVAVTEDA